MKCQNLASAEDVALRTYPNSEFEGFGDTEGVPQVNKSDNGPKPALVLGLSMDGIARGAITGMVYKVGNSRCFG